jgi:hypothetical protein
VDTAITQILGSTRRWKLTAAANRKPLTNVFTSSDTLSAAVWPGGSQAALFHPDVAWIDATAGTIQLTILASQLASASIEPQQYMLRVFVTPAGDGEPRDIYYGPIRFLPVDGSGSAETSIASYADVLSWSSDVAKLQTEDTDLSGFADQRNRAMQTFIQEVLRRYSPRLGGSRRFRSADGTTSGPYLVYATSPDGTPPPSRDQVAAWLNTPGRLVLNEDVIEANARLAAAIIYGTSPGQANVYQQMADKERALARAAIQRAIIDIDTSQPADGVADIRIDRDVIYLS